MKAYQKHVPVAAKNRKLTTTKNVKKHVASFLTSKKKNPFSQKSKRVFVRYFTIVLVG